VSVPTVPSTSEVLTALRERRVLSAADVHVTDAVARLTRERDPDVLLAIALAVRAPSQGHVCLELDRVHDRGLAAEGEEPVAVALPSPTVWRAALAASPAVRTPDDEHAVTPLVLDGDRVYLDRYWRYEQRLLQGVRRLAERRPDDRDPAAVDTALTELFPAAPDDAPDLQRRAAEVAASRALTVLTGGPGTGKTTTVVRLLATLLLTAAEDRLPRIVLAAPTGKAAARMAEAVRDAVETLPVPDHVARALRGVPASTLHRLLGWRPDRPTRFRHDHRHRLPYDVVVVDEVSMASLPLMAKLVDALDDRSRLVLVGDRDQLTSIDAGAVLDDLCGPRGQRVDRAGLEGSIVALTRFHRFGPDSGIGAVARAIQRPPGAGPDVLALLRGEVTERSWADDQPPAPGRGYTDVALVAPETGTAPSSVPAAVWAEVVATYGAAIRAALDGAPPEQVLAAHDRIRVLTALRRGPDGVETLNRAIETRLAAAIEGYDPADRLPIGRPLIVTRNDARQQLFNGDVGVVIRDPDEPTRRRVAFPTPDGGVRIVSPARVPDPEPVFAMSVHKSQGSQFARVVLVLPTAGSPLLSRELVYTGITRASEHVTVVATEERLREALGRDVQRASGLARRLWGTDER
jgi:exodeoxyribonuclease V alpha subunit